jgi:hypothetical protein
MHKADTRWRADDPLSAVDSIVARRLFTQVLGPNGILADRTRVLVTHQVRPMMSSAPAHRANSSRVQTHFLPETDRVVVMREGSAIFQGSFADFRGSGLYEAPR